ncbi:Maf family protein [Desulforegula conservatrix]|uniref:Maf family protein n=1 Tax=Desulforegula conservatrix TaxID=153026 RepID=UPI00042158D5|nr:Maf family protein [Desulforegula conservatrix]
MTVIIKKPGIILASNSPRRRELLGMAGIEFEVVPASFDEESVPFMEPSEYTKLLAEQKALEVARKNPDHMVIGADTIVVIDDQILNKPSSKTDAVKMLKMLSGRTHRVFTGICLACLSEHLIYSDSIITDVTFKSLTNEEINWYTNTDEPYDKAGGYAVQGAGVFMIESIKGSYTNVIGLPVSHVLSHLLDNGFISY